MWCDLKEEEREDCDCRCVLWYNGKFDSCVHWHEGEKDSELLEKDQGKNYTYSGLKESGQKIKC